MESYELAATTPLLLWMLSENHAVPAAQIEVGLDALESWVVRRTLLRMTMKDVNKLMVAMLVKLDGHDVAVAGDVVRDFLGEQTADARMWPSDDDVLNELPDVRLYGNVRQGRIRVVLEAIEHKMRTEQSENVEKVSLPARLEIEHVMPRTWRTHWDEQPPLTPEAASARGKRVDTLGNLTLVTKKLNGSLSHRPWTDVEAAPIALTGKDAGLGKRSLVKKFSILVLNKCLVEEHPDEWTEEDIRTRGVAMTRDICALWPRPA